MPIELDQHLREKMTHDASEFPISYFRDELATLLNWTGPLHWHPEFEIATALSGVLDYQVGKDHIHLNAGDSVFVNGNMLHGIRQISGDAPDPMPNIVFYGSFLASENSTVYKKYIRAIMECSSLSYIVFRNAINAHAPVRQLISDVYRHMEEKDACYELAVQRNLIGIFEYIIRNFDDFPKQDEPRVQINAQIRVQQMLSFIYSHYAENITLEDIARAASISRSEAGRCFNSYIGYSPVEALIRHRLQAAYSLLESTDKSIQEISAECGFNSVNYFHRQYRRHYACAPGEHRKMGK